MKPLSLFFDQYYKKFKEVCPQLSNLKKIINFNLITNCDLFEFKSRVEIPLKDPARGFPNQMKQLLANEKKYFRKLFRE